MRASFCSKPKSKHQQTNIDGEILAITPQENDGPNHIYGKYCASIKLNESISSSISTFLQQPNISPGIKIGSIRFTGEKSAVMSLDAMNDKLQKMNIKIFHDLDEKNKPKFNEEIYEMISDSPSTHFLKRKGFMMAKYQIAHQSPKFHFLA